MVFRCQQGLPGGLTMKIRWRGHASFIIETQNQTIVTDPFDKKVGYPLEPLAADLVTISHEHYDHNAPETLKGRPHLIKGSGLHELSGISIRGVASYHDHSNGRERGANTIFKISSEGVDLVHLGDLGHPLSARQMEEIGNVDILLVPVGGKFTIDAGEAVGVVNALQPKIVVPMHFSTPHLSFALAPVEEFISHYDQVIKKPRLEVNRDNLGTELRIIILDYL